MTAHHNDHDGMGTILPAAGTVGAALSHARAFCAAHATDADLAARLAIVVEELVMNLVEHGVRPAEDPIALTFARDAAGVRLVIEDGGVPFDPRCAPPVGDVPPERGGGAGIALVLAWSTIVGYVSDAGRNRLELIVRG